MGEQWKSDRERASTIYLSISWALIIEAKIEESMLPYL
jgi:hypothetical protein